MSELADELVEAWRVHNRINLFLLERISDEGLAQLCGHRLPRAESYAIWDWDRM
jgi:hypothetical protein